LEEIPSGEVEKFHNNLEKLEGMGWKDKNENIKFFDSSQWRFEYSH